MASQITGNWTVAQQLVQINNTDNVKPRITGPLRGEILDRWFRLTNASNAEIISMKWRLLQPFKTPDVQIYFSSCNNLHVGEGR